MKLAQARWEEQEARAPAPNSSLWLVADPCGLVAPTRIASFAPPQARLRVVSEAYRTAELAKLCGDLETAACVSARASRGSD